ncbi:hypothetical protein IRM63_06965 [Leuconostoc citreum]|uniref:hypothetical protein n=1 Tax=Leuconostoc citreum TaxID=33964 RepID=UPI001889962E|nr:hypothetical protein [Leuconostoc citreum]MCT3078839.1 hypothetical protein [Leuconostoc citreum]MCT3080197.1 hypothetical protein [Leuconostoc citreum]MCT3082422.1 hypothetical protein [Leuconostoc citreum]QOY97231.1 hypothetical protein IRM63_06965 [Leuconostoc citreum]
MIEGSGDRRHLKLIADICVALISIGSILSYTSHSKVGQLLRLVGQFGIISFYIWRVNFNKYRFIYPIVFTFVMYPLLVASLGIYNNLNQTLAYVFFFLWFICSLICISENYSDDLSGLIKIFYNTIVATLGFLFIFYRGISLNITEIVQSIISNNRYGGYISTARVSMGFQNVNQLGLFAVVLTVFSICYLVKRKNIIYNIFILCISVILILNSGSRTPILTLVVFFIIYFVYHLKSVFLQILGKTIIIISYILIYFLFIYLIYFSNTDSSFFQLIDGLFSFRISFSQEAVALTSKLGNQIVGIGPMSSSFIQNMYTGGNYAIDSSVAYYILTLGWVGSFGLNWCILFLMFKLNKNTDSFVISIFGFFVAYAFFENVLFTPNSGLGIIILSIVFTSISQKSNNIKEYICT